MVKCLGENGLLSVIQQGAISSNQCARLVHLHALADACLTNKAEFHLNTELFLDFNKPVVHKVTAILTDFFYKIEAFSFKTKFAEVANPLWIVQNVPLNNGPFLEFHSKTVFP